MNSLIDRVESIVDKLRTFKKEGKKFSFMETGDVYLAVEQLEKSCNKRQSR